MEDPASYQMLRDESKRNRLYTNRIACCSFFLIGLFLYQTNDSSKFIKFRKTKIETNAHHLSTASSIESNTYEHKYRYSDLKGQKHFLLVKGKIFPENKFGRKSHKKTRFSEVSKHDKQIRVFYSTSQPAEGITFKTSFWLRSIYRSYISNRLGLFCMILTGILFFYTSKKIFRLEYRIKNGYRDK